MLPEYNIIFNINRPKPGWKIDIPWHVVLTLFLWQIDTLGLPDLDELGVDSEMALACELLEKLKSAEQHRKDMAKMCNRNGKGDGKQ
jgi:hypothetical protein